MGALNIYKVDENKCQELIQALNEQMQSLDSLTINRQINDEEVAFGFTLYYARKEDPLLRSAIRSFWWINSATGNLDSDLHEKPISARLRPAH